MSRFTPTTSKPDSSRRGRKVTGETDWRKVVAQLIGQVASGKGIFFSEADDPPPVT